jgi:hypothetical protein
MAHAQRIRRPNITARGRSRRNRQMTSDVLKILLVLFMIILGYFAFVPGGPSQTSETAAFAGT